MTEHDAASAQRIRSWRRRAGLTRPEAAELLQMSERMLAYYEAGRKPPKVVHLAIDALEPDRPPAFSRERWVAAVGHMLDLLKRGTPVLGRLLRQRNADALEDMMELARRGPGADLATTDPSLFRALRDAGTLMYLSGIMAFRIDRSRIPSPDFKEGTPRTESAEPPDADDGPADEGPGYR